MALHCLLQRVSPLRRRPKGFPIALWKPSAPQRVGFRAAGTARCLETGDSVTNLWINTRTLYESVTNSIAKRVSRGSKTLRGCRAEPCRSPEAEPLAPPLYTKNSYFPCKSTKFEPEFRLNSGGFFFECVLYYMNEGSVRCKTDRNQTPPFRNDDAGEVGIVE